MYDLQKELDKLEKEIIQKFKHHSTTDELIIPEKDFHAALILAAGVGWLKNADTTLETFLKI